MVLTLQFTNFNMARLRYDPERLSSLNYDPIFSSPNLSLPRSDDIEPDVNFGTVDVRSDLNYIEDKFNKMLRNDNLCDEDFSLPHLNTRSLQRNLDSLSILLIRLNIKFSLIGVSETWLNGYSHSVDIDGFNLSTNNTQIGLLVVLDYIFQTISILKFALTLCLLKYQDPWGKYYWWCYLQAT